MTNCFVYVISMTGAGAVKVGVSSDPHARLRQIQIGNPNRVTLMTSLGPMTRKMARAVEAEAHTVLSELGLSGEWFMCSPEWATEVVVGSWEALQ